MLIPSKNQDCTRDLLTSRFFDSQRKARASRANLCSRELARWVPRTANELYQQWYGIIDYCEHCVLAQACEEVTNNHTIIRPTTGHTLSAIRAWYMELSFWDRMINTSMQNREL